MARQFRRRHPERGSFWHTFQNIEIACIFLWRLHTGYSPCLPYGHPPTNATFWKDATFQYDERDDVRQYWGYLARYKKALFVLTCEFQIGVSTYAWLGGSPLAKIVALSTPAIAGTTIGVRTINKIRRRKVDREYIEPLAGSVAKVLHMNPDTGYKWIHIPLAFAKKTTKTKLLDRIKLPSWVPSSLILLKLTRKIRTHGRRVNTRLNSIQGKLERTPDEAWIRYPYDLAVTPDLKKFIKEIIPMKIGGDDWLIQWHGKGRYPHIIFRPTPRPPELVTFSDIKEHMEISTSETLAVLGMGATEPLTIDIDVESPHIAISCGSGAGKSVLVKGLIAQWLHNGFQVIVLDGKRLSQSWCKNLPGVEYYRDALEMEAALVELADEADRRFRIFDPVDADDEDDIDVGPRIVCVFEEQNMGMQKLRSSWREEKSPGDLNTSPGMNAYVRLTQTGRQAKIHLVSVAQYFNQDSCVTTAARANYGLRILGRADHQAWMMLARDCGPNFPKADTRRGRMQFALGGTATEFQGTRWSNAEARTWASPGAVTVPVSWREAADLRDNPVTVTEPGSVQLGANADRLLTLREIADSDWCDITYEALRQRKSRGHLPKARRVDGKDKFFESEIRSALNSVEAK